MSTPILHGGSKFRQGVLQLMIHSIDPLHEEVIKNASNSRPQSSTKIRHIHPPGATTCVLCSEEENGNNENGNNNINGLSHTKLTDNELRDNQLMNNNLSNNNIPATPVKDQVLLRS